MVLPRKSILDPRLRYTRDVVSRETFNVRITKIVEEETV